MVNSGLNVINTSILKPMGLSISGRLLEYTEILVLVYILISYILIENHLNVYMLSNIIYCGQSSIKWDTEY